LAAIKIELIQPFIQGTKETFENFVGIKIRRKDVYLKKDYMMSGDISGIIGLSGSTAGNCAISMPEALAVEVVEKLMCEKVEGGMESEVVRDGVGEMINMIAGRAKGILSTTRYKFDITLPTIISGKGHEFFQKKSAHCVVIVFGTSSGHTFTLDVSVASR
jgi:chemotaxis protein CheX